MQLHIVVNQLILEPQITLNYIMHAFMIIKKLPPLQPAAAAIAKLLDALHIAHAQLKKLKLKN